MLFWISDISEKYISCYDVSCYRREAVFVCCIFLFFQKWQMFIISFKHCLSSSWTITIFSQRGLSLLLLEENYNWSGKRAYHRQSDHQSVFLASSEILSKCTRTRRHKDILDFTLHFGTLPLQKYTSEWDEKTEESQILLSRHVKVLASPKKQITWE